MTATFFFSGIILAIAALAVALWKMIKLQNRLKHQLADDFQEVKREFGKWLAEKDKLWVNAPAVLLIQSEYHTIRAFMNEPTLGMLEPEAAEHSIHQIYIAWAVFELRSGIMQTTISMTPTARNAVICLNAAIKIASEQHKNGGQAFQEGFCDMHQVGTLLPLLVKDDLLHQSWADYVSQHQAEFTIDNGIFTVRESLGIKLSRIL